MASETTVRLRDQRNPKHGWYDNEIYDVFGDELRQDGISVYMTMTRLAYGSSVRKPGGGGYSLRELAGHARMSKDTVSRTLKRIVELGLLLETRGSTAQSPSVYELVDVKELAAKYLRQAVQQQKVKSVSGGDTEPAATLAQLVTDRAKERRCDGSVNGENCLTGRQQKDEPVFFGPDDSATELSQTAPGFATDVSQAVRHPLRQDSRLKTQDKYTPIAPASGGVSDAAKLAGGIVWGVAQVMRECDATENPRLERAIGDALELHCSKNRCTAQAATELAIANVREYRANSGFLRFTWSWPKFFREGHWLGKSWPWDQPRLQRHKDARIGAAT